ncbi:hypothetical protein L3Q82_019076, partial [Scortum barcoo]
VTTPSSDVSGSWTPPGLHCSKVRSEATGGQQRGDFQEELSSSLNSSVKLESNGFSDFSDTSPLTSGAESCCSADEAPAPRPALAPAGSSEKTEPRHHLRWETAVDKRLSHSSLQRQLQSQNRLKLRQHVSGLLAAEEEETGTPRRGRAPRQEETVPARPPLHHHGECVRSLPNKMDELAALTRHQREYRECSLLLFTETWLTALTPDTAAELDGRFHSTSYRHGGQKQGERVVSVPPSANADAACDVLLSAVSRLQTQHPDALLLISGDFNHASPSSSLPKFTQYVTCHTRDNKTLDLFYANTKEAYHSLPLPPLGRADHNLVHLLPVYKTLVHRQPAVTRTVKKWSEEAEEALKDCFNTTLWDVFSDAHGEDIDSLTHCLTDYINFCVENTVPTRTVRSFSNSKPWITPDIKALLKEKRRAFVSGNKEELKSVQRELRRMIRKGKDCYRRKMEHQLQQNNICGVWKGLKTISGFKEPKSQPVGDQGWANDLNLFFNRFDQASAPPPAQSPLLQPPSQSLPPVHGSSCAPPPPLTTLSSHLPDTSISHSVLCTSPPSTPPCSSLLLTSHQVRNALKKNRARKAAGPDGISSRLLKSCADQLCGIFRTPHPKELNSYRPVALTSHLMKTLERLVLAHLRPLVSSFMDPLQFAYQPDIGVDDAVIYLLHTSLTHLEKAGSTVRIMFFDFSSAFNTIQPRLLGDKLQLAGVDHHLTTWILDYLTHRPQFVRVQGFESDRLLCSTGAPTGNCSGSFPVHPLHCRLFIQYSILSSPEVL